MTGKSPRGTCCRREDLTGWGSRSAVARATLGGWLCHGTCCGLGAAGVCGPRAGSASTTGCFFALTPAADRHEPGY